MRDVRLFLPGAVHFITFRTEEGLPFVPLKFMNALIQSALARAQNLYRVQLLAFTVEANHVHMLIRVINPEDVSRFIGYFKAESANYLNRLLNRRQRTVWAARYDSPVILDYQKALKIFAYVTLNPVKDGLVHSMKEYPGVSSYALLHQGGQTLSVKSIPRNKVERLKNADAPARDDGVLFSYFTSDEFQDVSLTIEPEALRLAFTETGDISPQEFRDILIATLAEAEVEYQSSRDGKRPLGVKALISASLLTPHSPPTSGKKMICLSSIKELRQQFISYYRRLRARCREVYRMWKCGDVSAPFPSGMFAPSLPRVSNLLPRAAG